MTENQVLLPRRAKPNKMAERVLPAAMLSVVLSLIFFRGTGGSCRFEQEQQHGALLRLHHEVEEDDCLYGAEEDPCWGLRCLRGPGEMCGGEKTK